MAWPEQRAVPGLVAGMGAGVGVVGLAGFLRSWLKVSFPGNLKSAVLGSSG